MTDKSIEAISNYSANLHSLTLARCSVTSGFFDHVARLRFLHSLKLKYCDKIVLKRVAEEQPPNNSANPPRSLTEDGEPLLFPHLTVLKISGCTAIADLPFLPAKSQLTETSCSNTVPNLRSLHLIRCHLLDDFFVEHRIACLLPQLEDLVLKELKKVSSSVEKLLKIDYESRTEAELGSFLNLRSLTLHKLPRAGSLLDVHLTSSLQRLDLSFLYLSHQLQFNNALPHLEDLTLSMTNTDDATLQNVIRNCTKLRHLALSDCHYVRDASISLCGMSMLENFTFRTQFN